MPRNPWLTSDDLLDSIKRKITFPASQNLFEDQDILNFCSEELLISQVPEIMKFHEEYFVTYESVTLESNQSRYPIPERAIGYKLRSVFYEDNGGNLFELTRIDPQDKAYFQADVGTSTGYAKYFLEGSELVLLPSVTSNPTGFLRLYYYLRPSLLVTNDQAAIINYFLKTITVNAVTAHTITITPGSYPKRNITSISTGATPTITAANHGYQTGDSVILANTNSIPSVDGTYTIAGATTNTFTITPTSAVTIAGTQGTSKLSTGSYVLNGTGLAGNNSFSSTATLSTLINNIGLGTSHSANTSGTKTITTISMANPTVLTVVAHSYQNGDQILISGSNSTPSIDGSYTISDVTTDTFTIPVNVTTAGTTGTTQKTTNGFTFASRYSGSVITFIYNDIDLTITTNNGSSYQIENTVTCECESVPTDITDNSIIDFLKTKPDHMPLGMSIVVPNNAISYTNNTITFNSGDMPTDIVVGDYICLENQCIIPQIPSDLHNGLAERTCARILAAIGDQNGLTVSTAKIQDINRAENMLINNRVDGNPLKILNRNSPLRQSKLARLRRFY